MILIFYLISQNLPFTWSQSYSTFDKAECLNPKEYSIGFGIDNYCIYSSTNDTIAYDERRFDLWIKSGIVKKLEFGLKYSYPTAGLLSLKYQVIENPVFGAFKFGFGYMKGTRVNYITDYVYDFYGYFLIEKKLFREINFLYTPKIIYSMHYRDRQEHSDRPPRYIFHIGHCFGLKIGRDIEFIPEINWLWGNNEGVKYMVNQFGIGASAKIN
uniref:Outer membrane protein beta-barrel domain-containing protein n=1 Tax=candidate division WOR-3 bacterium TaxID=2052148 RepID=A0A7C6EN82_UNCW3